MAFFNDSALTKPIREMEDSAVKFVCFMEPSKHNKLTPMETQQFVTGIVQLVGLTAVEIVAFQSPRTESLDFETCDTLWQTNIAIEHGHGNS